MEEKTEVAVPGAQTRQESMVSFCESVLAQVRAGNVTQIFVVTDWDGASRVPLIYLNHDFNSTVAASFVSNVCNSVSHVVDCVYARTINAPYPQDGKPN